MSGWRWAGRRGGPGTPAGSLWAAEGGHLWASQSLGEGPGLRRTPPAAGKGGRGSGRCNQQQKKCCGISPFQVGLWATCPREPWWAKGDARRRRRGQQAPEAQLLTISTGIVQVKTVPAENVASGPWNVLLIGILLVGLGLACAPSHGLSAASLTVLSHAPSSSVTSPPPGQEVLASPWVVSVPPMSAPSPSRANPSQ